MHIKIPKPMHGWRVFAGEVGIIVIGVLIALGAQQAVEWLNSERQTAETDERLRSEIQESVDSTAERVALDPCLKAQLASLHAALLKGERPDAPLRRNSPARVVDDLYSAPWRPWTRGTWDSALASGALTHMNGTRLAAYSQVYTAIEDIDAIIERERATRGALAPLSVGNTRGSDAAQVLGALMTLDRSRNDILIAGRTLLDSAAEVGVRPNRSALKGVADYNASIAACRIDAGTRR